MVIGNTRKPKYYFIQGMKMDKTKKKQRRKKQY